MALRIQNPGHVPGKRLEGFKIGRRHRIASIRPVSGSSNRAMAHWLRFFDQNAGEAMNAGSKDATVAVGPPAAGNRSQLLAAISSTNLTSGILPGNRSRWRIIRYGRPIAEQHACTLLIPHG